MQWQVAIIAIASVLFLLSFYAWLSSKGFVRLVSGWLTFYLLINFVGVCLGYTLHTKGFMTILFSVGFLGLFHISKNIWERYY